jgi:hypothetical protein
MKPLLGGKGREPRRDDPHRAAGASRLHHHHRGLHLLLRQQADLSEGSSRRRSRPAWPSSKKSWAPSSATAAMPLLVSVRSGARDSMPGMMDTILNLGLNDETVLALGRPPRTSGSPGIATAASSRCTATSSWACKSARTKTTSRLKWSSTPQARALSRRHRGHQADRRRSARNSSPASRR